MQSNKDSMRRIALNLRDLGGIPLQGGKCKTPHGLYLRSGKLGALTLDECKKLCQEYHIACVIDLRTTIEAQEFPDPLPDGVEYELISLLKDSSIGITHETGSDPMTIIRSLRK
jgi:protein-tyrosine phosphatase